MGDQVSMFPDAVVLVPVWVGPPPRLLGYEWHHVRRVGEFQWKLEDGKVLQLEEWDEQH